MKDEHDTRITPGSKSNGRIALHFAAKFCSELCARLLIKKGSKVDATDDGGETPLDVSIYNMNCPVMKLLVSNGASLTDGIMAHKEAGRRKMFACEACKICKTKLLYLSE